MKKHVDLDQVIEGRYTSVAPILRLDFDTIVRRPLDGLRVAVGGGSLSRSVTAEVGPVYLGERCVGIEPGTLEIPLAWRAARHPAFFPTMRGRLVVQDAGYHRVLVRLVGTYRPPFGPLGWLIDRLTGRRAATGSLRVYLRAVATELEATLRKHRPRVEPRRFAAHARERSP